MRGGVEQIFSRKLCVTTTRALKKALQELSCRNRTAEQDPSKLAWERAGDQPEPSDDEVRGEKAWVCFRKGGGRRSEPGSHKIAPAIYM